MWSLRSALSVPWGDGHESGELQGRRPCHRRGSARVPRRRGRRQPQRRSRAGGPARRRGRRCRRRRREVPDVPHRSARHAARAEGDLPGRDHWGRRGAAGDAGPARARARGARGALRRERQARDPLLLLALRRGERRHARGARRGTLQAPVRRDHKPAPPLPRRRQGSPDHPVDRDVDARRGRGRGRGDPRGRRSAARAPALCERLPGAGRGDEPSGDGHAPRALRMSGRPVGSHDRHRDRDRRRRPRRGDRGEALHPGQGAAGPRPPGLARSGRACEPRALGPARRSGAW